MKQVKVSIYKYAELTNKVREKVKERYYEKCHSAEDFDIVLRCEWEQIFGPTEMPEIQYDFSATQCSGVNLYTKSFDYFTYGEYKYQQLGFDYFRYASKILSDDYFVLTLTCNQYYTYSLLDRDLPAVLHDIVEDYPNKNQRILTNFITSLFIDLKYFENRVLELGNEYFDDMSDELYTDFLQDHYFLADGTEYSRTYESI